MFDTIPGQTQPFQVTLYLIDIFFLRAFWIRVIDAQNESALRFARNQIIHQCGAHITDMQIAGWGWCKTRDCHWYSPVSRGVFHTSPYLSSQLGLTGHI